MFPITSRGGSRTDLPFSGMLLILPRKGTAVLGDDRRCGSHDGSTIFFNRAASKPSVVSGLEDKHVTCLTIRSNSHVAPSPSS